MGHIPFISFDLSMSTLLYFTRDASGTSVVSKQVDYHNFESILYSLPVLGWILERGFRAAVSWQIIVTWPAAQAAVRRGLQRTPGLAQSWQDLVAALPQCSWPGQASRWRFVGRRMAPYDPSA